MRFYNQQYVTVCTFKQSYISSVKCHNFVRVEGGKSCNTSVSLLILDIYINIQKKCKLLCTTPWPSGPLLHCLLVSLLYVICYAIKNA